MSPSASLLPAVPSCESVLLPLMHVGHIILICHFSDLVHTTESLRNAKLSAGKPEAGGENHDSLLEPYRAENARLVRENNELHLELLRAKEEKERATRGEQVFTFLHLQDGVPRVLKAALLTCTSPPCFRAQEPNQEAGP